MSLDQVNQIMGCKADSADGEDEELALKQYEWINFGRGGQIISVFFDPSTITVTGSLGNRFKGFFDGFKVVP